MDEPRTSPTWLQLLADDAPATAFHALRDLLIASEPPHRRAVVEAESARALELRASAQERARRAAELTALHEITSQLTALRDPERLLQDIAARARELLGVDIAYLALRGEGIELTIRVAAGSLGTRLRGLVMSTDTGIAGEVVTSGRAFWTADYGNEPAIRRSEVADEVAREERLGGILGVPLRVREEVIGVLFAADRSVREFDTSAVALLSSLASHAASAIDNARLYDSLRATAAELQDTNVELRESLDSIDRAASLHEQLTGIVVRGGGVAEIVAALSNVLGGDVELRSLEELPEAVREDLDRRGRPASPQTRLVQIDESRCVTASAVAVGEEVLAWLVAEQDLVARDADLRLIERAALVTALVLVRDRSLRDAELRARHELVAALLRGTPGNDALRRRAMSAGLRPARPHVVVSAASEGTTAEVEAVLDAAAHRFGGVAATYEGEPVAILATGDVHEVATAIQARLGTGGATVGVAVASDGIDGLAAAHGEARRCVSAAAALGRRGQVVGVDDLGIYRFLLGGERDAAVQAFVERVLAPLVTVDEDRGSDLLGTVEAYLTAGRHHSAAANALHIHPNTLYQRLARVEEVLGEGWREADRALELQLALRLRLVAAEL